MKRWIHLVIYMVFIVMIFVIFVLISKRSEWQQSVLVANETAVSETTRRFIAEVEVGLAQETSVAAQVFIDSVNADKGIAVATAQAQTLNLQATIETVIHHQAELEAELATQQELNLAYDLALASHQLWRSPQPDVQYSTLLAIEAVRRQLDPNTLSALSQSLEQLPDLQVEMEFPHTNADNLLFSKNGRFLLSWGWDVNPRVWDTTTGEMLAFVPNDAIYAWSEDGRYLALNKWLDNAYIFDTTNEQSILTIPNLPQSPFGAVAFSSDNTLIAYSTEIATESDTTNNSNESDDVFVVQNIQSGEEILHKIIEQPRENVVATYSEIAFSHDGQYIAGANRFRMDIWDMTTQQVVIQYPLDLSWPTHLIFSPNNAYLVVAGFDGVKLWDMVQNQEILLDPLHGIVQSVQFSADGQYLLITRQEQLGVGEDGSWYDGQNGTQVWDVTTGDEVLHLSSVNEDTSFMTNTHQLLTIDNAGVAQVWDVETKQLLMQNLLNGQIGTRINHDGTEIAGIDEQGQIRLWSPEFFMVTQTIYPMTIYSEDYRIPDNLNLIAYSPDSTAAITGGWDGQVRFWDPEGGLEQAVIFPQGILRTWAYTQDGMYFAVGGGNYPSPAPDWIPVGYTDIWHQTQGKVITLTHEGHVKDMAFSPNGRFFATATDTTQLWDINNGEEIPTCVPELEPLELTFLPDGDSLVVLTTEKVIVCDTQTAVIIQEFLPLHNPLFLTMALHPNGRFLALAETEGVQIWDLLSHTLLADLSTSQGDFRRNKLFFSPNGSYLGSLSQQGNLAFLPNSWFSIWDTSSWQAIIQTEYPLLNDFAFSYDDNLLALGDQDGTVHVLSLPDKREIYVWHFDAEILQLVFQPDNEQIALLSWHKVFLWNWNPMNWVTEACHRLSRNLTQNEWLIYFGEETYVPTCSD